MNMLLRSGEARPQERDWFGSSHGYGASSEENKLELTLGPPGEHWSIPKQQHQHNNNTCNEEDEPHLSLSHMTMKTRIPSSLGDLTGDTRPCPSSPKFLHFSSNAATQGLAVAETESLFHCNSTKMVELQTKNNDAAEKQGFLLSAVATNTAVPNTSLSQKRIAAPVVGWPPIRSFRKNLASTSTTKTSPGSQNATHDKVTNHGKRATEAAMKGLYVKVNMDGIPIGRKVDLNAYDSYERLSSAVDQLFRGLLAAQSDTFASGVRCEQEEEKPITGLLGGSGEYTLVYEDNEGDRVLVGDVPWCMFVPSVKRLRLMKTSDLSSLSLGSKKQKMQIDSPG